MDSMRFGTMLLVVAAGSLWFAAEAREPDVVTVQLEAAPGAKAPALAPTRRAAVSLAVSYKAAALTISAENAPLSQVLSEVCRQIGATLDFPADANDRVTADVGPAPTKAVLALLLGNTRFDYATSGRSDDPAVLAGIVVFPKSTPNAQGRAVAVQAEPKQGPAVVTQVVPKRGVAPRVAVVSDEQPALKNLHDLLDLAKAEGPPSSDATDDTGVAPAKVEEMLKWLDAKVADPATQPEQPPGTASPAPVAPGRRRPH